MNRRLFKCSRTFIGDHFNLLDRVDSIFKAFPFKPDELSNNSTPDFWLNPFSKRVREACPDERQCKDPFYRLAECDRDPCREKLRELGACLWMDETINSKSDYSNQVEF